MIRLANSKKDREGWLKARSRIVTASDVGALLGEGSYKKRVELLEEKVTGVESFRGSVWSRAGSALEDAILDWAVEEFEDWAVAGPFQDLLQDPECPYLGATPDAMVITTTGEILNCQVKCTAKYASSIEDDQGNITLPYDWYYQMQVEMACLGPWYQRSCLLAFHRREMPFIKKGSTKRPEDITPLVRYYVERDDELIDDIRHAAEMFWKQVHAVRKNRGIGK